MLHAVANRKLRGRQPSEDEITSAVFGPLRYVDAVAAWTLFSSLLSECDGTLPAHFQPERVEPLFWPRWQALYRKTRIRVEPDLLLRFHDRDGRVAVILIEVKWDAAGSSHGEQGRYDQLARQQLGLLQYARSNPFDHAWQLYLTKLESKARPEIEDAAEVLGNEIPAVPRIPMANVSWHRLAEGLKRAVARGMGNRAFHNWAADVLAFLNQLQVVTFSGFAETGVRELDLPESAMFWQAIPGFSAARRLMPADGFAFCDPKFFSGADQVKTRKRQSS